MHGARLCDEIIRLIDEALAESTGAATVRAPGLDTVTEDFVSTSRRASGVPRLRRLDEHDLVRSGRLQRV